MNKLCAITRKKGKKYEIFNTSFMAYHLQHIQTEEDTSMKWLYLTGVSSRKRERERIVYLKLVFSSKVILMPESIAYFNNDDPLSFQ